MLQRPADIAVIKNRSPWLFGWFVWSAKRMARKQFHSLLLDRVELDSAAVPEDLPVIVFTNHPGWWDPIVAVLVNEATMADRKFFAPMDAQSLRKYAIMQRLGFYGIDMHRQKGAHDFLRISKAILMSGQSAIYITPEGKFVDARNHSIQLQPGLTHLCVKVQPIIAIPMAIEYAFWDERKPYLFARLGKPLQFSSGDNPASKPVVAEQLGTAMRQNQTRLSQSVIARSISAFQPLIRSK